MEERPFKRSPKKNQILPDQHTNDSYPAKVHLDQEITEERNINTEILTDTSDSQKNIQEDIDKEEGGGS
jgi:hypothetical protein